MFVLRPEHKTRQRSVDELDVGSSSSDAAKRLHSNSGLRANAVLKQIGDALKTTRGRDRTSGAISSYEGGNFALINSLMQKASEGRLAFDEYKSRLGSILEAEILAHLTLQSRVLKKETTVWRGIDNSRWAVDASIEQVRTDLKKPFRLSKGPNPHVFSSEIAQSQLRAVGLGQTIVFPTFLSTSLDESVARKFALEGGKPSKTGEVVGYILEIILPKSSSAMPLSYGDEYELLLSPCTSYVVTKVSTNQKTGLRTLRLRPLPAKPPSLQFSISRIKTAIDVAERIKSLSLAELKGMYARFRKEKCPLRSSALLGGCK